MYAADHCVRAAQRRRMRPHVATDDAVHLPVGFVQRRSFPIRRSRSHRGLIYHRLQLSILVNDN